MVIEIPLGKWSKYKGMVTLIDDEDLELVGMTGWRVEKDDNNFYAIRSQHIDGRSITVRMHRLILNPGPGMVTDHIDGDGLNNVRANLRQATVSLNGANCRTKNRTGFQGVNFEARSRKNPYFAQITMNGKRTHLGCFATAEEAARAYDEAKIKLHGPNVTLNFPEAA